MLNELTILISVSVVRPRIRSSKIAIRFNASFKLGIWISSDGLFWKSSVICRWNSGFSDFVTACFFTTYLALYNRVKLFKSNQFSGLPGYDFFKSKCVHQRMPWYNWDWKNIRFVQWQYLNFYRWSVESTDLSEWLTVQCKSVLCWYFGTFHRQLPHHLGKTDMT